ncbi:MAG: helix-turn-helix transcriptional regulator [Gammaproteobacteria bacterium]|nr:helix-turn-helix transcriptional regulator [Gammaproteobacteria bacterium]
MPLRSQTVSLETYNSLVASIYDAAIDESLWINVTEDIARLTDSKSALMRMQNYNTHDVGACFTYGIDPEYKRLYSEYYAQIDPLVSAVFDKPGYILQTGVDTSVTYRKSEFYNDYIVPQGNEHVMGGMIVRSGSNIGVIGIHRCAKQGIFEVQEYKLLKNVMPHMNRAFNINKHLMESRNQATAAGNILDRMMMGVVLVDQLGRPQYINSQAESVLSKYPCIKYSQPGIQLPKVSDTHALQSLIRRVSSTDGARGDILFITNPVTQETIKIIVLPMSEARSLGLDINMTSVTAALFIETDGTSDTKLSEKVLMDIYKLTHAEARLAASLTSGQTLEKIAESFNLSLQTLRSQLKSCFRKTDTKRQSELVKLIISGPAALIRDEEL